MLVDPNGHLPYAPRSDTLNDIVKLWMNGLWSNLKEFTLEDGIVRQRDMKHYLENIKAQKIDARNYR